VKYWPVLAEQSQRRWCSVSAVSQ